MILRATTKRMGPQNSGGRQGRGEESGGAAHKWQWVLGAGLF